MKTTSSNSRPLKSLVVSKQPAGGFTLLEVLIALLLLVLLAGALYGTYFSVSRATSAARERTGQLRDLRVTLDLLRRELSAAWYNGANRRLHFVVEDRDVFGKPASTLDFTAFTVPRQGSAPSSDVMSVRYHPLERGESRLILYRQTRDLYLESKTEPYPLTGGIEGFLVECHDGNAWVRSWDTALNGRLPKAVRVTITVLVDDRPMSFNAMVLPRVSGL